jgi:serine/threonine protein kinase
MAAAQEVSYGDQHRADGGLGDMPSTKDDKLAYRRLRLLGQGSFGKAFLARDLANNELCVMKQIRVEKMDAKARDTAVREAVALRRIRHPNVVRFRQVFVRSGWLCLVMDFADGGDLCAAVKERARSKIPFEESAVLESFGQVADAVNWVHSVKMVHRDIKSRNIFLCRTGRALLGDFGLVRLLESTCELAHTRVGTPYYLSPEIIRKQPYNYRTDVWSLGVLLYEMAGLQRPFTGTLETLPRAILKGQYEPLGSHYSQGVHDLVAGFLQVNPENRLDLRVALDSEVLSAPLERAREALNLEEPTLPEAVRAKRADKMRKDVQSAAQQMKSEFIGYNTMCRRSSPILPPGVTPEEALALVQAEAVARAAGAAAPSDPAAATFADRAPENWSMRPEKNPDSEEEAIDSVSEDSWGEVVETGVEALAQINHG